LKPPLKTNGLSAIERLHFAFSLARQYAHQIFFHKHETMLYLSEGVLRLAGIKMP